MNLINRVSLIAFALTFPLNAFAQQQNVILFVADGLRAAAVSPETTPTMARIRNQGVNFMNSHSLFPTVTTANASAIATGHYLGDTGDFGNSIYSGFPVTSADGIVTPFIQNNAILAELNRHTGGNFLGEHSLMAAARERGYVTAVLGKVGPVGIQDVTQLGASTTIFFDDDTGTRTGIVLRPDVIEQLKQAGLPLETPGRAQTTNPGKSTNIIQQTYYRDIVTKVILPHIKSTGKPFMIVYWSPDPDGTQHSQLDSPNELTPGINGPTSLAALKVADDDLTAIMAALKELDLESTTNVFITADHGFSTVSKQTSTSPSARLTFPNVPPGQLPPGFVAIDLAIALGLPMHEPFAKGPAIDYRAGKFPRRANAILGHDPAKPDIAIAANGGADLIYLPQANAKELAPKVVEALFAQDYVSGIFVHDSLGEIPGTLALSTLRLQGRALTPTPSIVVNFRSFSTGCDLPLFCGAIVADTLLKQGQGHHGSLSRSDTANFMAAIGPAFKQSFIDPAPVSNADIAPTLAQVLGMDMPAIGRLTGRVATESLKDGAPVAHTQRDIVSKLGPGGLQTIVNLQYAGETPYFTAGGFAGRTLGLKVPAEKIQPVSIIIVRHPESDTTQPTVPLTEVGRQRADLLIHTLRGVKFTHFFSSHTTRSRQAVEKIAAAHGLPVVQLPQPGSLVDGQPVTDQTTRRAPIEPVSAALLNLPPGSVALVGLNSENIYAILNRLGVPVASAGQGCAPGSMCVPCTNNECYPRSDFDHLWHVVRQPDSPEPIAYLELRYGAGWQSPGR